MSLSTLLNPEEVLAETFVLLVNGVKDLPTPWVVEELKRVLRRSRRV